MAGLDPIEYNRHAWDRLVEKGNQWTIPVSSETLAAARKGQWEIVLTPRRPVPKSWFPPLAQSKTLCLASGGGQQGPVLAAAGASVTVFDNSPRQLAQDRLVADREGLELRIIEGDMRDLRVIEDSSFDLVVHPCANCFVPNVLAVWREVFRVLRPGGILMMGAVNPAAYIFDESASDRGELIVRHPLPYSDQKSLTETELQALVDAGEPLVFSHSLDDLIAGQIEVGFIIDGFYEDQWPGKPITAYMPTFIATRATKP